MTALVAFAYQASNFTNTLLYTMTAIHFTDIPFEVLTYIFEFLRDTQSLLSCALISRAAYDAVKPSLFYSIKLRHTSEETSDLGALRQLARYPYLRTYVHHVRHHAPYNESAQGSSDTIPAWAVSLGRLENLRSYALCSTYRTTISQNFLESVVHVLIKFKNLREIRLNFNVYSYHVPVVRLLSNLPSITLGRPSRAVLAQITPWIEEFKKPLESLSISNGTKVEPEIILPLISSFHRLKRFTLGPGHKLSRTNLLRVVANLPNLQYLDIFYDNFITDMGDPLPTLVASTSLNELIIRHQGVSGTRQFVTLVVWLTILVMPSRLRSLTIISDDGKLYTNPNDFVACLPRSQSMNLRVLRVAGFLFNGQDLRTVLSWKHLEVLEFRLEDTLVLDACMRLPNASIKLPFPSKNLNALLWITTLQETVVMAKIKLLVTSLGRERGTLKKIRMDRHTSEWQGFWSMPGKEELVGG